MLRHMELCRWLYNELLRAIRENPSLRRTDTQRLIVELKKENPELKEVYSKVLQMVNHQLWNNLTVLKVLKKNGHKVGRLRYKTSPNSWKSLNYNQSGFKLDEEGKRLHLSKVGEVPIKLHRKIKGEVKGVIIKRTKTGKWYAIFQVEEEPEPLPKTGRAVGIDLGVANFVVDSDGNAFENPLFFEKSLERVRKIQRRVSRKQKGSKNWEKERIKLAKAYEKLTNQRTDFLISSPFTTSGITTLLLWRNWKQRIWLGTVIEVSTAICSIPLPVLSSGYSPTRLRELVGGWFSSNQPTLRGLAPAVGSLWRKCLFRRGFFAVRSVGW